MDNRTDNCTNDRAYNKMQKIKDKSKKNLGRFKKKEKWYKLKKICEQKKLQSFLMQLF